MRKTKIGLALATLLTVGLAGTSQATFGLSDSWASSYDLRWRPPVQSFQRIATLGNYLNRDDIAEETVSEIIAATQDGNILVYTDSPGERIGFIDIADPSIPQPIGTLELPGEPTSVDILDNNLALVAVNTSESFVVASGQLVVVEIATRTIIGAIELGGQPDSIKISPDRRYVAIAIENERDEEIEVGDVEGGLPQLPAGFLAIVDIKGKDPANWLLRTVDLTGLASYAPEDPEPEFVDINAANEAVVSLQENNHLAIVDLVRGVVTRHFEAGTVSLDGIDATEDDVIALTESLADIPREPDAVAWVPTGRFGRGHGIATANEGDLFGGSRGFSIFDRRGGVLFDSGASLEEIAVQHGHYPESRSENKGNEPESIEYGRFGARDYLFVGSERGSFVAIYELTGNGPVFKQLLPAPLGPEGLLAIPSRNLLIATGENDDPEFGVRSAVMIYQLNRGRPTYPEILSDTAGGSPIPWSALSGLVAVPGEPNRLLAVWDSYYSESRIFGIDVSAKPAVITDALTIQGGSGNYDPEGIAVAPDGTLWIASEGNASDSRPNRLLQVDPTTGQVMQEIGLPPEVLTCRAATANRTTLGSGFEGVAVEPIVGGYRLLVAQQRGWDYTTGECEALDDDAGGLNALGQPNLTRIWIYDPKAMSWDHVAWELAALPVNASWVGLSEITRARGGSYVLIERDNLTGDFAALKTLVRVSKRDLRDGVVAEDDKAIYDLIPRLKSTHGWITDKPEGVAITAAGRTFVVTDNDGVDDWSGETWFMDLGFFPRLFD
ncbi:esterase-like activity of phytase family protein [Thiocapsa sp.]|uniref:esterase-like activity of phytase family protein n=1 Tax=Thiocapsa sp. TaxID=2024551 RepID=UPI002BE4A2EF|nr:esterase-like activity of phytase family protein [Thiocapsa sp.]HSO81980.1 esterase-like activity of phytase family protein [Thiocapsa sp.]